MGLKVITLSIIAFNAIVLAGEIPLQIILFTVASLVFSIIVTNPKIRQVVKVVLLIVAMFVLRINFKILLSTECGVSLILMLASLKFWELKEPDDHFNMFLILALSECSIFLLNPSFLLFVLGLFKMVFYFYYILKIRNYDVELLNIKRLILLVAPSLIFSLALFYTFPRFTQGFLNLGEMQAAMTGINSQFNFKTLGPLNQSSAQVFRVYGLSKEKLNLNLVYWRSNVLWTFVNQEWRSGYQNLKSAPPDLKQQAFQYKIEYLLKDKEFLPTLDGTSTITESSLPFNYYIEGSHRLKVYSRQPLSYNVNGFYYDRTYPINGLMLHKGLRLKSNSINEISAAVLGNIRRDGTDEEKLKELIDLFKKRDFEYSLSPPAYDSLELFILQGKYGYCTHFAAAFAYMARALALPSRLVVGYLGGETNPFDGSLSVKELDAHTWVEIFLEKKGWTRVDPTALVAPARLQMSSQDFIQQLNPYLSFFNMKISRSLFQFAYLVRASQFIDSINSRLTGAISSFDRDEQRKLLQKFNPLSLQTGWIFSGALLLFLISTFLLTRYLSASTVKRGEKRYKKFLVDMKKLGINKHPYETALAFRSRCIERFPSHKQSIEKETEAYIHQFYC